MSNNSYLCSFHIPKTGGTTFASHARKSLKQGEFLLHGPFSRLDRFFNNLPQVEELNESERSAIKVVHGHGADLTLAEAMVGRIPEFMVIMRNPYDRFVSGFNHYNSERTKSGLDRMAEDTYFKKRGTNFYAKTFYDRFGSVLSDRSRLSAQSVLPTLQCIKYFILTEHLDRQLHEICKLYGFDTGAIEARRINASKAPAATDIATFNADNDIDCEIYTALADAAARSNGLFENPFGYKPELVTSHLEQVWSHQTQAARLETAYSQLAEAAKKTFRLQALYLKLRAGRTNHVVDKPLLLNQTREAFTGWIDGLNNAELSVTNFWSGAMFAKERDFNSAENYLRESLRHNPKNENALTHIAKVLSRRGKKKEAVEFIKQALALNPGRKMTQVIGKLILG